MTTQQKFDELDRIADGAAGFVRFCRLYAKIEDKERREAVPFALYPAQEQVADKLCRGLWLVILKARQLGLTTELVAYCVWRIVTIPNYTIYVMNQDRAYAAEFLKRFMAVLKALPTWMQPTPTKQTESLIEFKKHGDGCSIRIVAATENAARSATADLVIFDEAAYIEWLREALQAATPSVEHAKGQIILLSSSDGPSGAFYDTWMGAPGNGFTTIFLPWSAHPNRDQAWYEREKSKHLRDPLHVAREYPSTAEEAFSAGPNRLYPLLTADRHRVKVAIGADWKRYRGIDWGWSGAHLFVCLWAAHDPTSLPRLTIDPDCVETWRMMLAVSRDPDTGKPIDEEDHAPDVARYLVGTFGLVGHVHIYRELVVRNAAERSPSKLAADIHKLSGWRFPETADPSDIGKYEQGSGEKYEGSCADKRGGGWIKQFNDWGLGLIPHTAPDPRQIGRTESIGEVEDGIAAVQLLIAGDALPRSPDPPTIEEWAKKQLRTPPWERPHVLSPEQEMALQVAAGNNQPHTYAAERHEHF